MVLRLGSMYGLIAIGYSMVYGIIGMINFAHGEIYMIGAFLTIIVFTLLGMIGLTWVPLALLTVLIVAMLITVDVRLDGRAAGLPAAARLVPPGAADLGDRHVDLPAELRPDHAGRQRQAAAAEDLRRLRVRRGQRLHRPDRLHPDLRDPADPRADDRLLAADRAHAARPLAARLRAGPEDGRPVRRQRRPDDLADLRHGCGARGRRRA